MVILEWKLYIIVRYNKDIFYNIVNNILFIINTLDWKKSHVLFYTYVLLHKRTKPFPFVSLVTLRA